MFNNKKKRAVDTLINQQTIIKGKIEFSGVLYVDGIVNGDIISTTDKSVVTIGARGKVKGEIRVPHVIVFGTVTGDIHANEDVELLAHSHIEGNVYYQQIQMTMGSEVNGKLVHTDMAQTQRLEHKPIKSMVIDQNKLDENATEM